MDQGTIERLALGSVAELGSLYDARMDKFCGISILKKESPTNAVRRTENCTTECKFVFVDKLSDKFTKLDVSAELSLSILSGLITVKGSGEYFKDEKRSARAVHVTLAYDLNTVAEELNILNNELKNHIELDALSRDIATYVVVGIDWGAKLIITAVSENEEDQDPLKIRDSLEIELKKMAKGLLDLNGMAYVKSEGREPGGPNEYSLSIKTDVPIDGELPQTLDGARDLMEKLSSFVSKTNNGKGLPLRYVLLPLASIQSHFSITLGDHAALKGSNEATVHRMLELFDVINESKQKLNDLCSDVIKLGTYLPDAVHQSVIEIQINAAISETKLRGFLQTLLVNVRAGKSDPSELEQCREDYEKDPYSAYNVLALLSEFDPVRSKIEIFRQMTKLDVVLVSKNESSIETKVLQHGNSDCYVLFSDPKVTIYNKDLWNRNFLLFQNLRELNRVSEENAMFFYVDTDAAPHLAPPGGQNVVIQHFKNGICTSQDLFKAYSADRGMCFVQSGSITHKLERRNERAGLEIRCPGSISGECEVEEHKWRCFKCKSEIEYGFDDFFYCTCGQGRVETYSYRCSSEKHGDSFEAFPVDGVMLKEYLAQLQPMKQLNILVLGETGVGKSTWINGILNYVNYETLEEAIQGELLHAIPMSFTTTDDDYNQVRITVGEDENENSVSTASATQYPKSYTFSKGDTLVRLIDTPGIGDTKGIDQDKINFERILSHLSYIEEINGICILLKPNDARLTVVFRFCIKELLTHLHRDASKNIVFCFTNSRSTLYKPGETLTSLKTLLNEMKEKSGVDIVVSKHTLYPMDNEAIRFLAALKHGITFDSTEKANFAASWDKSVAETARLFLYVEKLTPHFTKNTLSLNEVRRMIMELTRPLAEIGKNIRNNISVMKDKEDEINRIDIKTADLEKVLKIPVVRLETVQLGFPRTVCASPSCVKKVRGFHDIYHNVYEQVCHDHCYLKGVSLGSTYCVELQYCDAMAAHGQWATCRHCKCSWYSHMHQNYDVKQVDDHEENSAIQQQLGAEKDAKTRAEALKMQLANNIKQLENEEEIVTKVSAKFAVFLKKNAMAVYNDATADYLDHLIAVEQQHTALGKGREILDGLRVRRAAHEREKEILELKLITADGAEEISIQKIQDEINILRNLPMTGPTVVRMIEEVNKANTAVAGYSEVSLDAIQCRQISSSAYWKPAKSKKKRGFWLFRW